MEVEEGKQKRKTSKPTHKFICLVLSYMMVVLLLLMVCNFFWHFQREDENIYAYLT